MGHAGGDTDCYGASFALAAALTKLGKEVRVMAEADFPESLGYLFFYYNGEVVTDIESADLLILLDSSDLARVVDPAIYEKLQAAGTKTAQIDHHTPGDLVKIVDVSFVDARACSASELVYRLVLDLGVDIDKNIATCLLAGIIGDTSSFQNQNTTKECFAIASELMKRGARLGNIVSNTFGGKEVDVLKVWGLAMERLTVNSRLGLVSTYLTYEDIDKYGLSPDVLSGIVNFLNSIKGARVIMLVTEQEPGMVKVSLRTRDEHQDVARIAKAFGGGGHVKAAGFSLPGSLKILTEGDKKHIVIA